MDPISLIVASMQNDMQRMNSVANNAANAMTPGFKREIASVMSMQSITAEISDGKKTAVEVPVVTTRSDPAQGVLRQTGRMLDVALSGEGYFEVLTPQGSAYTRKGTFSLDADGYLVTDGGYRVSGQSGDLRLGSSAPQITRAGAVSVDGTELGVIRVVKPASGSDMVSVGQGLYVLDGNGTVEDVDMPRVHQGNLEASNVDSTREMIHLMEVYRHYEAGSKVLQAYGDLKESTFTSLGSF